MEERHVVGVRELPRGCSREVAEPDREHRCAQRVLERLTGAEVRREREGTDDLGNAYRLFHRGKRCYCRSRIVYCHKSILRPLGRKTDGADAGRGLTSMSFVV